MRAHAVRQRSVGAVATGTPRAGTFPAISGTPRPALERRLATPSSIGPDATGLPDGGPAADPRFVRPVIGTVAVAEQLQADHDGRLRGRHGQTAVPAACSTGRKSRAARKRDGRRETRPAMPLEAAEGIDEH